MDNNTISELIEQYGIATADEISLVTDINGYSEETLNNIIYARTGYHSIMQYMSAETYD